jgi:hypothetical protein
VLAINQRRDSKSAQLFQVAVSHGTDQGDHGLMALGGLAMTCSDVRLSSVSTISSDSVGKWVVASRSSG